MADNTGEPFGLPPGTIRGVLALAFTAATLYMFIVGQPIPPELLAINGLVVGNYFGYRQESARAVANRDEALNAPFIPGEDRDGTG